ncbi:MAG: hypothetical protein JWN46_967 [Acidimicrobiales bacterium]|nr:hypothetical protein [Acidimicrobiales bacterium]
MISMGLPRADRLRRLAAVAGATALAAIVSLSPAAFGAFSGNAANAGTAVATKRIFSGTRTFSAHDLRDSSSGTEVNVTDPLAVAGDARTVTTSAWTAAFSSTRYFQVDLENQQPAKLAVTGPAFRFTFASASASTTCAYLDVRTRSTNAVLATYGSAASPLGCATTTAASLTTALPVITSTDQANDLRVRVYLNSTAARAAVIDQAAVTGSNPYATFTLYPGSSTDASSGSATVRPWSLYAAGDGATYVNATAWRATFDATRYYKLTFPAVLPTGATVTAATLSLRYVDNNQLNGTSVCYYVEVFSGATSIGTHGSAASPLCNATSSLVTDTITLAEVNTAAIVNALSLKAYVWDASTGKKTTHDLASLAVTYSLT